MSGNVLVTIASKVAPRLVNASPRLQRFNRFLEEKTNIKALTVGAHLSCALVHLLSAMIIATLFFGPAYLLSSKMKDVVDVTTAIVFFIGAIGIVLPAFIGLKALALVISALLILILPRSWMKSWQDQYGVSKVSGKLQKASIGLLLFFPLVYAGIHLWMMGDSPVNLYYYFGIVGFTFFIFLARFMFFDEVIEENPVDFDFKDQICPSCSATVKAAALKMARHIQRKEEQVSGEALTDELTFRCPECQVVLFYTEGDEIKPYAKES